MAIHLTTSERLLAASSEAAADCRGPGFKVVTHKPPEAERSVHLLGLRQALSEGGGMIEAEVLVAVWRAYCNQPPSMLARWIVQRQVLCVVVDGACWLPMFRERPATPP
ncbi:hypothetical protein ASD88_00005 [Pelomonas sp. Root662]|nr:hypothetical protein ASC81_00005 [Pelomonas sp. Root405]KRA77319.1 hypothetical protein ASD88_00005 [Pelomonas sp. Root662]